MKASKRLFVLVLFLSVVTVCSSFTWAADDKPADRFQAMKARSVGPAGMSGRVTAITADPLDSKILYVGTASGGLWKSRDGGMTWKPIFDDQPVASIGSIAVDPHNPDIVWVGSGEGNPRNSQCVGNGVYKSLDGGRTWKHLGLEETEHIHRVLINPNDGNTVYVAALGKTWGENPERGVFKTTDGGSSWKKVLYINEKTGIADLVMDPRNPDKLIAAAWEHRRWPWFFKSGGPGSGIHVTYDGGETWARRTDEDGLPKGELGRVGLAISRNKPDIVYALVEAKKNALYRSDDGGYKWKKINDSGDAGGRPFYYSEIYVDPTNENRIFSLHSLVSRSEDGGKSFQTLITFNQIHPDHHAMWIDPGNPDFMLEGNDGGLAISRDRGNSWRFVENLPLAQFYHVNVDSEYPYNIYGGLQDNGSWKGASAVWASRSILNADWKEVGFGDGFDVMPDQSDNRYLYSMSQGGNLRRLDTLTGDERNIRPPDLDDERLRFNWNAALAQDPFDPKTIYYGSQFVHRSPDRGDSWEVISPDLTTDDPEKQKQVDSGGLTYDVTDAENHTTIITIAPSPVAKGVIWAGTDDGNVQVTRDGGKSWANVVGTIPDVPKNTWVPHIEPSKFKEGEAFVVFDDHRRANWTTYVLKTEDFGQTWTSLVTGDLKGYAHVIEQDPVVPNLLFLGTEFHLYFSLDAGSSWQQWKAGLPTVAVRDLVVHPREADLVIATFGRAVYVIDDIRPLREMAQKGIGIADEPLHLYEIPPAIRTLTASFSGAGVLMPGDTSFKGDNRPYGAMITYSIGKSEEKKEDSEQPAKDDGDSEEVEKEGTEASDDPSDEEGVGDGGTGDSKKPQVKIEIFDPAGTLIRTLKGPAETGLQRVFWRIDRKGVRMPGRSNRRGANDSEPGGPSVPSGTYSVKITHGENAVEGKVPVTFDPRISVTEDSLQAREDLELRSLALQTAIKDGYDKLQKAEDSIDSVNKLLADSEDDQAKKLKDTAKEIRKAIDGLQEQIVPKPVQGIRDDPTLLRSSVSLAASYAGGWEKPNATEELVVRRAEKLVEAWIDKVNTFFKEEWSGYRDSVEKANLSLVKDYDPVKID